MGSKQNELNFFTACCLVCFASFLKGRMPLYKSPLPCESVSHKKFVTAKQHHQLEIIGFGPVCSCMVLYCPVWSCMVPCPVWSCMVQYGPLWSRLVLCGPIWSRLVPMVLYGPLLPGFFLISSA